jgi:hypothetical protein
MAVQAHGHAQHIRDFNLKEMKLYMLPLDAQVLTNQSQNPNLFKWAPFCNSRIPAHSLI